ncbi:MAG: EAL domain-containing protein [Lachnospiraceae bacterium]|nr:EAL domain-containing protein [Lachnospiraceae bacterium]
MNRVIGVIVSRVQYEGCKTFIGSLFKQARNAGYRVCVFQSIYDFSTQGESGAAGIFEMIPYNKLCALVMLNDAIYDKEIVNNIIETTKKNGIPMILAKGEDPRCYNIIGDFEKTYEHLIRKILVDREVKDVFYITGKMHEGSDAIGRLNVFKKVVAELGIPFDDSMVAVGDYAEKPAKRIIDKMLESGNLPPRAIFCANDVMALGVMERLAAFGYSVPIDTVVAGFDGLESATYGKPRLATCAENMDNVCQLVIKAITEAVDEGVRPKTYHYEYEAIFSESAGYYGRDVESTKLGNEIFRRFRTDEYDEEDQNNWLDRVMVRQDLEGLRQALPSFIENKRSFIIRQDPYWEMMDERAKSKMPKKVLLVSRNIPGNDGNVEKECDWENAMSFLIDSIPDNKIGYASSISMHDMVYGVAFILTRDPYNGAGRMNRFAFTVNRAFSLAINGEKQQFLAEQITRNRYMDPVTSMHNMDGAVHWYTNYLMTERSRHSYLTCGVFKLMNYQQLMNSEGIDFIEDALQFIANTLVLVNPDKDMIARISSDSFGVVMALPEGATNAELIDQVITDFYQILDVKKKKMGEPWNQLELSCGYEIGQVGDRDDLSLYFDSAITKLYKNRSLMIKGLPGAINIEDGHSVLEYKGRLLTLLKDNLFKYNFQPIVDAHTGDIVAYEGLMRTSDKIGLSPMEVLSASSMFEKNQDVEYATFLNILRRIEQEPKLFEGKKLFVNTIPGWFLNDEQIDDFRRNFGEYLSKIVVEITETETIEQDELTKIRTLCGDGFDTPIAIDDYGTGHSNIVNLLEYQPQVIKVDRYLVSNINEDTNKQMFVKSILEFGKTNNILVLAEGVETREELKTVIEFGVDLIQGYYTARPSYEIVQKLPDNIVEEIREFQVQE